MKEIQPHDIFRYYVNYKDIEEPILKKLNSNSIEDQDEALRQFLNYMAIARNFEKGKRKDVFLILENYVNESTCKYDPEELNERFKKYNLTHGKMPKLLPPNYYG